MKESSKALVIAGVATGAAAAAAYALSRAERRGLAEDNGEADLVRSMLATSTITPAILRADASVIRAAGGDVALVEALEIAATSQEAANTAPLGDVVCRPWATCTLYAEPTVFSAYVDGLDTDSMRAVARTENGWTRVVARSLSPVAGLVLDPTRPATGEVAGWIRTSDVESKNGAARTFAAGEPSTGKIPPAIRDIGLWATSTQGQVIIGLALTAAGVYFPPAWFTLPFYTVLRLYIAVATEFLLSVLRRLLRDERFDRAILGALMDQFAKMTGTLKDVPAAITNGTGIQLPANLKEIGTTADLIALYSAHSYANAFLVTANPAVDPEKFAAAISGRGGDFDLALQRAGVSPQQLSRSTSLAVYGDRSYRIPFREDAVAQALNHRLKDVLGGRPLYSPDWYRPSDGRFLQDRAQIVPLMQWERIRAQYEPDPQLRQLHAERLKILERNYALAPRKKMLKRVRISSPLDPPPDSRRLYEAAASARAMDFDARVVARLDSAAKKAAEEETTRTAEEVSRYEAAKRASVADEVQTTQADETKAAGIVEHAASRAAPSTFMSDALLVGVLTSPAWIPLLVLPALRARRKDSNARPVRRRTRP